MAYLIGNGLLPLPLKIDADILWDGSHLVTVLHNDTIPYAAVYRVIGTTPTFIGRSTGTGKTDSGSAFAAPNGDVFLYVSQADPGQSGSTSKVYVYPFPAAVPANPGNNTSVDQYARDKIAAIQAKLYEASDV